jgi:hypothetical protein
VLLLFWKRTSLDPEAFIPSNMLGENPPRSRAVFVPTNSLPELSMRAASLPPTVMPIVLAAGRKKPVSGSLYTCNPGVAALSANEGLN